MGTGGNQPRLAPVDGLDAGVGANDYRTAQPGDAVQRAAAAVAARAAEAEPHPGWHARRRALRGGAGSRLRAEEASDRCRAEARHQESCWPSADRHRAGVAAREDLQRGEAARVSAGRRGEAIVRWEGFNEKHDTWEPMDNLSNLVEEMAAFDLAKQKANEDHLRQLAADKAARQKAREEAGTSGAAGPSGAAGNSGETATKATEVKPEQGAFNKKVARCYEAFRPSNKPGYAICIATEGVAGGCECGEELKVYTQSLWNHLEGKHPRHWQELKGKLEAGAPIDGGIVASIGAGATQTTIIAPMLTEARKKQCDRACASWLIKSSRPLTLPVCPRPRLALSVALPPPPPPRLPPLPPSPPSATV